MAHATRAVTLLLGLLVGAVAAPAVAQDSGAAEKHLNDGVSAFADGDYAAARRSFETALRYQGDFAAAHYLLGLTLAQLAQTAQGDERNDLYLRAIQHFDQARVADPSFVTADLDKGLLLSRLDRFEEAEKALKTFTEQHPNDPWPNLILAAMYFRMGKQDAQYLDKASEQLAAADATLAKQETPNPRLQSAVLFWQALIDVRKGNRDNAQQSLQRSIALDPESDLSGQARELLQRIESGELGRRPWDFALRFGLAHDTNVTLLGEAVPNPLPTGKSDSRIGVGTSFTYRFADTDEYVIGAGVSTFHSWHHDIDSFDVQTYGGSLFAGYSPRDADWLTLGLRYDYDYSLVGRDKFLSRHRITPQVSIDEAEWSRTTGFYQYQHLDYLYRLEDERLNRDGDTHSVGLVQEFKLFKLWDRPVETNASVRFENVSTVGTEFAMKNCVLGWGLSVPLPENFTFDFSSEFENGRYKNRSIFSSQRDSRKDSITTLVFGLTKEFNENVSLRFEVDWTQTDSNITDRNGRDPFGYDRVIYGLALICEF